MKAVSASNGHITMFSWKSLPRCQPLSAFAEVVQRHHATGTPEMFAVGRNTKDTVTQEYEPTFGLYAQYCQKYDMSGTTIEFLFTDTRDARMATRTPGMGAAADGGTFEHYISMASPDAYSVCGQMLTNNTEHPTGVPMAYATPEQLRRLAKDFDNFDGTIDYNLDVGEAPAGPGPATTFGKATKSTPPNVHNQLIRDLYAELPNGIHEGIVVSDRLTGVPVTMVPSYDQRGDLVMVETREMPAPPTPVVPTTAPSSTAPAAAPTAVATPRSTRPPPRPSNRPSAVPPKDTVDRLHALGDDVAIRFVQPCPKRPGTASFKRYEAYMSCTTLGELRKMWPKRAFKADYAFDYHHGYLTFENPATLAFVGSIWSELLLPANDFFRRTEQQQDVTEERVTAVTATTIAANTNRDEIDYFDGGWDWSQHDAETRRQLSINKWGGANQTVTSPTTSPTPRTSSTR